MEIKIIGENSSNRMKLLKNLNKVIKKIDGNVVINLLETKKEINKYGITNYPGLVINEKIISQGKILTERELINYIRILS